MITTQLARYIADAPGRRLPDDVREAGVLHVLDTVAAMVSGSTLEAGRGAGRFLDVLSVPGSCTVVGLGRSVAPDGAALANGMLAHADESDDSHGDSVTHPGCSVIPAALAMGEHEGASGEEVLRAVVAGYDVGPRIAAALGGGRFMEHYHHVSFGGVFGAAAAAAVLTRQDETACARTLTFAVHHASGSTCWLRDPAHVEKGFVFGGLPAQNGVRAALMGATGVPTSTEPLEGVPGLFAGYPEAARPELAVEALGERFEVSRTAIKKWSVGSPCQAAMDVMEDLVGSQGLRARDVAYIHVTLPERRVQIVQSSVANLNLSHLLALFLVDGGISFESVHDIARMDDPEVRCVRARIRIEVRPGAHRREHAVMRIARADGRVIERAPRTVRGQPEDPMTADEVTAKAHGLMEPVLGAERTRQLIAALRDLPALPRIQVLGPLLQPSLSKRVPPCPTISA